MAEDVQETQVLVQDQGLTIAQAQEVLMVGMEAMEALSLTTLVLSWRVKETFLNHTTLVRRPDMRALVEEVVINLCQLVELEEE